jgi:hypothetical protein
MYAKISAQFISGSLFMGACFSKKAISLQNTEEGKAIDEAKKLFTYENMIKFLLEEKVDPVMTDSQQVFGASIDQSTFIRFGYLNILKDSDVGWKMHISVDDRDIANIAKAWNLLKDIFIDEKLIVKVVRPHSNFYKDDSQHGKQVTMYVYMSMPKELDEWKRIFNTIEEILSTNNILNNKFPPFNKPLLGSKYLSYRNDDKGDGTYIASPNNYNPSNQIDPFQQIELQPDKRRLQI